MYEGESLPDVYVSCKVVPLFVTLAIHFKS